MQKGALWLIYELILSYMIVFVYVSMGMNVSMKRKDNKTVMGHNRHYSQKGDITRSLELQIGDKSENGEQ